MIGKRIVNKTVKKIKSWAINSAVECYPHMVEVTGSNPVSPKYPDRSCRGFILHEELMSLHNDR